MVQKQTIVAVVLVILVPLAGCAGSDTPAAPTGTETPTQTATPPAPTTSTTPSTATPTPTASPTPTPTTSPTPTPTETDVDSPIEGGTARVATVTKVTDGDTVKVDFKNGETDTIRMIGVDTPETVASNEDPSEYNVPDTARGRDWLLNWGEKAKSHATDQLAGARVTIVTDPEGDTRGSYGRLLAYIYVEGQNVNQQLVKRGYARRYDNSQFTLRETFGQLETDAQRADRRVWGFEASSESTPEDTPVRTGDQDCDDFDTHQAAQAFFEANNPGEDPHRLDSDGDGQACESLP